MQPFWIDIRGNKYNKEDIDDRYLKNIIGYLRKGGFGYKHFADLDVVNNILNESVNRGIYDISTKNSIYYDIVEFRDDFKKFKDNQINAWIYNVVGTEPLNH